MMEAAGSCETLVYHSQDNMIPRKAEYSPQFDIKGYHSDDDSDDVILG
jgi:hypothetical protein